jgi:hypothetical protein
MCVVRVVLTHVDRSALHDNNVSIREGGVDALHAALALISERENRLRTQWYHKIYEEAQKGLRQNTGPTIHGSLITLGKCGRVRVVCMSCVVPCVVPC